ncbi:MAG: glycine/betaine/sarcosine/D-proline family reductase selenoprotein B [Deltaproteobacteria bacterium]|nr:glycine/betaine/sarcosine/D-proline family reductase selenoprotein B [Deltaproteobacteria bacterium]
MAKDLVMPHTSTNFDRTGFQLDWNVVFPLDRLRELKEASLVGSITDFHYSFMGVADPDTMEEAAQDLAGLLKKDQVDGLVLVPV